MLRYYERMGMLPPAQRNDANYRVYSQADLHRLRFVRRARDLGFSVAEIKNLLDLWNDQGRKSADVRKLAQQHLQKLNQRMQDLQQIAATLDALIQACAGDERPDCPILGRLEQDGPSTATA